MLRVISHNQLWGFNANSLSKPSDWTRIRDCFHLIAYSNTDHLFFTDKKGSVAGRLRLTGAGLGG